MKKHLCVAAMLAFSLTLGSCGEAGESTVEDTTTTQATTTATETTTTTTTTMATTIIETEPIVEEKEPTPAETIEKKEDKNPKAILQKQAAKMVDYDYEQPYFEAEYREDGNPISEVNYMRIHIGNRDETIYEYDDDNNLIKESVYSYHFSNEVIADNGITDWERSTFGSPELYQYTSYEYDKGQLKTKTVHLNDENTVTTTYEYNDNNDITKKTIERSSGRTEMNEYAYKYDKDGKISEIELTATDPLGEKTNVTSAYKYDGNGNLIEIDNVLDIVQSPSLEYDELKGDEDFSREAIAHKIVYEYDSSNRITGESLYLTEEYECRRLEYDTNGNIIKNYNSKTRSGWMSFYEYEYDENDNLISEICFDTNTGFFVEPIKTLKLDGEVYFAYNKILYENTYY